MSVSIGSRNEFILKAHRIAHAFWVTRPKNQWHDERYRGTSDQRRATKPPSDEATVKEAAFERAMVEAKKLVEEAQDAANDVKEQLKGQDIKSEDQVGVHACAAFLHAV